MRKAYMCEDLETNTEIFNKKINLYFPFPPLPSTPFTPLPPMQSRKCKLRKLGESLNLMYLRDIFCQNKQEMQCLCAEMSPFKVLSTQWNTSTESTMKSLHYVSYVIPVDVYCPNISSRNMDLCCVALFIIALSLLASHLWVLWNLLVHVSDSDTLHFHLSCYLIGHFTALQICQLGRNVSKYIVYISVFSIGHFWWHSQARIFSFFFDLHLTVVCMC